MDAARGANLQDMAVGLILEDIAAEAAEESAMEVAAFATLLTILQQQEEQQDQEHDDEATTEASTEEDGSEYDESSRACSDDEEGEDDVNHAGARDGYSEEVSAPAPRPVTLGKRRRSPSPLGALRPPPGTEHVDSAPAGGHHVTVNGVKRLRRPGPASSSQAFAQAPPQDQPQPQPQTHAASAAGDPPAADMKNTWVKMLNQTALRMTGREMSAATEAVVRQMDTKTRNDLVFTIIDYRARFAGQVTETELTAVYNYLRTNPASSKRYIFENPEAKTRTFAVWVEKSTGKRPLLRSRKEDMPTNTITGDLHSQVNKLRQPRAAATALQATDTRALLKAHLVRQVDQEPQGPLRERVKLWLDKVLPLD